MKIRQLFGRRSPQSTTATVEVFDSLGRPLTAPVVLVKAISIDHHLHPGDLLLMQHFDGTPLRFPKWARVVVVRTEA